jgi:hypothetical protein
LIVTGGTLAALPFRRSPVIPDASSHLSQPSTQATGPLQSALDATPVHLLASSTPHGSPAATRTFSRQEIPGLDEFIRDDRSVSETPEVSVDRTRPSVKPLTYEDLMAPIDRPGPIQDRYQAIAAVQADSRAQSHPMAMELPPIEQLEPSLRGELEQRFMAMKPKQIRQPASNPARASGSLASSMIPRTPDLPDLSAAPMTPEPAVRQHHWIVQP